MRPGVLARAAFALALAAWCFYAAKSPSALVNDNDYGLVLTGASELLAGRWPYVSFFSNYGPATYASAALFLKLRDLALPALSLFAVFAQWLSLLALAWLAEKRSRRPLVAAGVAALGALFIVQPYFFWMSLVPLAFLTLGQAAGEGPAASAALGALAGLCFLFRHDFGCFLLLAGAARVACSRAPRARAAAAFAAAFGAVLAPWLAYLALNRALSSYADQLLYSITVEPVYNLLPLPFTFRRGAALGLLYWFFYALPAAGALALARAEGLAAAERRELAATLVVAGGTLLYSLSYAGYWHLAGAVWPALTLAPLLYRLCGERGGRAGEAAAGAALALALACALSVFPLRLTLWKEPGRSFAPLRASPPEVAQRFMDRDVRASVGAARRCTGPGEAVFASGDSGLPFYSGRRLAGRHLLVENGFFAAPRFASAAAARLDADPPALIVEAPGGERPNYLLASSRADDHAWLRAYTAERLARVAEREGLIYYTTPGRARAMAGCLAAYFGELDGGGRPGTWPFLGTAAKSKTKRLPE